MREGEGESEEGAEHNVGGGEDEGPSLRGEKKRPARWLCRLPVADGLNTFVPYCTAQYNTV